MKISCIVLTCDGFNDRMIKKFIERKGNNNESKKINMHGLLFSRIMWTV